MSKPVFNALKKTFFCVTAVALVAMVMLAGCGNDDPVFVYEEEEYDPDYTYTGRTVRIGDLTWMAENLNRFTDDSWCYKDNRYYCDLYGKLYTWDAAMSACPVGWRLSTYEDWQNLIEAAGGLDEATGKRLKSADWGGTDDFGFSALPGGYRHSGLFFHFETRGGWWIAPEADDGYANLWAMSSDSDGLIWDGYDKPAGFSVRCVQE